MKLPIFTLLACIAMPLWSQIEIQVPDEYQNVKIDSVEISLQEYVEAISDDYDDPFTFASNLLNENGKIWMYYETPLPKKKKQSYHAAIPLVNSRGLEAAELLTGTTITGLDFDSQGAVSGFYKIPPDVHGAAGTSHVGYVVNTAIDFYTTGGISAAGFPQSLKTFFNPLSPATDTFDPKILWDQYEDRWLVVTLEKDNASNLSKIFIAVSATADPTGSWYFQAIDAAQMIGANDCWFDYPGFAVDEEAIYVTGNYFKFSDNFSCSSSQVLIIDKGLSGGFYDGIVLANDDPASSGGAFTFYDPKIEAGGLFNIVSQPAHMFGTGPSGLGTYLVGYSGLNSGSNRFLHFYTITNPLSSPTFNSFTKNMGAIGDSSGSLDDIPQSGGSDIESNDRRTLNAQWANNDLWVCFNMQHDAGPNVGQVSAYFVKANATGSTSGTVSISTQGAVDGEDISSGMETWNPAICIDNSGNGAMVFSACDANNFASSYVAPIDGSNGSIGPSTLLAAGVDTYERTFGGGSNRWGDYAGITVDPTDGDIWAFSQAALNSGTILSGEDGRWGVFIEEFQGLVLPIDLISFEASLVDDNVDFSWVTANEYDCESYEIEYLYKGDWTSIHEQSCDNNIQRSTYNASFTLDDYGTFLFRLKQIDFDRSFSVSAIKSVHYVDQKKDQDLIVYPNPFNEELELVITSKWRQNSILELLDISGKTILSRELVLQKDQHYESLDLSSLKSGIYTIRLSNASGIVYRKVIKSE